MKFDEGNSVKNHKHLAPTVHGDAVPGGERAAFLAKSPLHVKLLMEAKADLNSPCLLAPA